MLVIQRRHARASLRDRLSRQSLGITDSDASSLSISFTAYVLVYRVFALVHPSTLIAAGCMFFVSQSSRHQCGVLSQASSPLSSITNSGGRGAVAHRCLGVLRQLPSGAVAAGGGLWRCTGPWNCCGARQLLSSRLPGVHRLQNPSPLAQACFQRFVLGHRTCSRCLRLCAEHASASLIRRQNRLHQMVAAPSTRSVPPSHQRHRLLLRRPTALSAGRPVASLLTLSGSSVWCACRAQ
jgi:hypothetical protein